MGNSMFAKEVDLKRKQADALWASKLLVLWGHQPAPGICQTLENMFSNVMHHVATHIEELRLPSELIINAIEVSTVGRY
jgi:hypothetical protein